MNGYQQRASGSHASHLVPIVLQGAPTLVTDSGEHLEPGMCAGFPAGGTAHHLENRTASNVVILEVGDRSAGDEVTYPQDDLQAVIGADGKRRFAKRWLNFVIAAAIDP